jgi:methanol--5-hydroxybenzimidazolylcobamide Co-methyltransferase
MQRFNRLAIPDAASLLYGRCPHPVTTRDGLVIGGGTVYPELNFTLPPMTIEEGTFPKVRREYEQMIREALRRAAELHVPGVVVEFETLPPMTAHPDWAVEITRVLLEEMQAARDKHGLAVALRVTPNDNREMVRPPQMRGGHYWETLLETFERCAAEGAELLSIESVGGKEIHDDALMYGDMRQVIFALGVLGVRDMQFLWSHIVEIAERHGAIPAGDTACGFANTAMVLADQGMISRVFATVVRTVSAVRSLVAYEQGALGPGKDCGYENTILKAITGRPMSLEGKAAACAHLSPVGNLPMGLCDLWSNESVQNVKLLGGMAPTVSMEQLVYDCRLLNEAHCHGEESARQLRDWLIDSDIHHDPQAYILSADCSIALAETIVAADSHYHACIGTARKTIELLTHADAAGQLALGDRDRPFLEMIAATLDQLPDDEEQFIEEMLTEIDLSKVLPAEYDLPVSVGH